ncbi:hypothetical protein LTR85_002200 [Meristemomyces frigidus]|nr:hypothetical protein LTR85_002200 [Meristemomyces frigidus]
MALDLRAAYESGEFTDLIIVAEGGRDFMVHKLVVCQFGPIKALNADAPDGRVELPESPTVVEAVLRGMYGFKYQAEAYDRRDAGGAMEHLQGLVETCIAAEKYEVRMLADTLATRLEVAAQQLPGITSKLQLIVSLCGDDLRGRLQQTALNSVIRALLDGREANHRAPAIAPPPPAPEAAAALPAPDVAIPDSGDDVIEVAAVPQKRKIKPTASTATAKRAKKESKAASAAVAPYKRTTKAVAKKHCHCQAKGDNRYLIQCGQCEKWWHPGCIGKGRYEENTYIGRRKWAQGKDVD